MFLLPPSLNEWVREDHPSRVFSEIIDKLDTTAFRQPKEEGRPAYHPAMMIKVLLWGYATGVRSSSTEIHVLAVFNAMPRSRESSESCKS
jgi:transposase